MGEPGAPGENGYHSLIRMTAEPAGSNCFAGGVRIDVGLDDGLPDGLANNEILESEEIEQTNYVCNATSFGTLYVESLSTDNCTVVDHDSASGDDRGGIAVAGDYAYYTGDIRTVRFDGSNLGNQTNLSTTLDGIVSDLDTGYLYSLATESDTPFVNSCSGQDLDRLLRLDPADGSVQDSIMLSEPILGSALCYYSYYSMPGMFAGPGFMLLVLDRVYLIDFTSGAVLDLAERPADYAPYPCENWASWGIAEHYQGEFSLVYRNQSSNTIARTTLANVTTTVGTFTNLSDMCSLTGSPSTSRWFFHHEGGSQFGGGSETMGACDATFLR